MASGKGGRRPLVADRRYPAGKQKKTPVARKGRGKGGGGRTPRRKRIAPRRGLIGGLLHFLWRIVWGVAWRVTAIGGLILAGIVFYFYSELPPINSLLDARSRGSVTLLDRNGTAFAWRGENYGGAISAESVSPHLRNAVIATEDRRFYYHPGISPRGIIGAIRINLREGRGAFEGHGGSTITQQVAKLLCLGVAYDPATWKSEADYERDCRGGGIWRKIKEVPYALAMELKYSKNEILTVYLNRAYLGAGARGFAAAAERYFAKPATDLTPAEAAMLAGLLQAPSALAPTNNLERSQNRANVVVDLMEAQGYLNHAEAEEARTHPASPTEAARQKSGGFFADWVMETTPDYLARDTTEDVILETTLDQRIQHQAEEALAEVFATRVKEGSKAQAAVVVMSADGAVRAMIGGRGKPRPGDFNRATHALRQTGSAFKPFVYAVAMDLGYSPLDYVEDSPYTIRVPGSGDYSPKNYDREFKGMITLTQALAESRNVPAVKVQELVGRDLVRKVANEFGIAQNLADGPALALGASESTLIDMTGAYAGILNGGSSVTPYGLVSLRLRGDDTALFGRTGGIGERVISETAAHAMIYMMTKVIENGTGRRARLPDREAAGKTGTTNSTRDAWFVGFTADYVTGVWLGYDDNTPLTGVTGGGLPAEIWHEIMVRIDKDTTPRELPKEIPTSRFTGVGPGEGTVRADEVPYFDAPDAPAYEGGSAPVPPAGTRLGPVSDDSLAEQILRELMGN